MKLYECPRARTPVPDGALASTYFIEDFYLHIYRKNDAIMVLHWQRVKFLLKIRGSMAAKTILVVDDEIFVLDSIERMLSALKYTVLTAPSGSAALDVLTEETVDLILLDIRMPDIDGKRVCTKVREVEPDIPIIIMTGIDVPDTKAFAEKEGAFGFLEKPIELEKLRSLIEAAIGKTE